MYAKETYSFFDNVYAYGHVTGVMTEETPFNPNSRKGEVRAKIATMLLDEIKAKNLNAMIVRGADFYGPGATLSLIHSTVTERLKAGKGAQWIFWFFTSRTAFRFEFIFVGLFGFT